MNSPILKLASTLPTGSAERRALLRLAEEFPTKDALAKYLKEHPGADKSKHSVKETQKKPGQGSSKVEVSEAKKSLVDSLDKAKITGVAEKKWGDFKKWLDSSEGEETVLIGGFFTTMGTVLGGGLGGPPGAMAGAALGALTWPAIKTTVDSIAKAQGKTKMKTGGEELPEELAPAKVEKLQKWLDKQKAQVKKSKDPKSLSENLSKMMADIPEDLVPTLMKLHKLQKPGKKALLKLASSLPKGDETHRAILAELSKVGMEFPTKDALDAYLKEHPDEDKSKHSVKETEEPKKKEDKPSGAGEKFKNFLSSVKGVHAKVKESLEKAPDSVKAFVSDPEVRKKALGDMSAKLKESPGKIADSVAASAKKELHEIKHAGTALKKVFAKPVQEWTKEDKAAVYSAAVYAAGAALSLAGGGPLIAAGAVGKSFVAHVAIKSLSQMLDTGFLHFEAAETLLHAAHSVMGAEKNKEPSDEEYQKLLMDNLTLAVSENLGKFSAEDMKKVLQNPDFDPSSLSDSPKPKAQTSKKTGDLLGVASRLPKGDPVRRVILGHLMDSR